MADNKALDLSSVEMIRDWAESTFVTPEKTALPHGHITLTVSWNGNGPYTQTVTIPNITSQTKIDLQPSASVLEQLMEDGVTALLIENNGGVLTAYALGAKPSQALTIQYTRTEVAE